MIEYKCKIMINRINLILRAKNITARQFAEEIGIQPSGMSHIMGGRNNPSLDFVTKVIRRYPEIDANWLIMGRGAMYAADNGAAVPPTDNAVTEPSDVAPENNLFSGIDEPVTQREAAPTPQPFDVDGGDDASSRPLVAAEPTHYEPAYIAVPPVEDHPEEADAERKVVRMILVYSDDTFREYIPQR